MCFLHQYSLLSLSIEMVIKVSLGTDRDLLESGRPYSSIWSKCSLLPSILTGRSTIEAEVTSLLYRGEDVDLPPVPIPAREYERGYMSGSDSGQVFCRHSADSEPLVTRPDLEFLVGSSRSLEIVCEKEGAIAEIRLI